MLVLQMLPCQQDQEYQLADHVIAGFENFQHLVAAAICLFPVAAPAKIGFAQEDGGKIAVDSCTTIAGQP